MLYYEARPTRDGDYFFRIDEEKPVGVWATIYRSTADGDVFDTEEAAHDAAVEWLEKHRPDEESRLV